MHNISPEHLEKLVLKIYDNHKNWLTDEFLSDVRALYETTLLLQYQGKNNFVEPTVQPLVELNTPEAVIDKTPIDLKSDEQITVQNEWDNKNEDNGAVNIAFELKETEKQVTNHTLQISDDESLSVEERIKAIMEKAALLHQPSEPTIPFPEATKSPIEPINNTPPTQPAPEVKPNISLEEEMKVSYSAQLTADIFDKAEKVTPVKKSLNDKLSQESLQIGLNDRIAFVKHLFDGNLTDFSRIVSQLNSFQSLDEAVYFIEKVVKQDYQWSGKEALEQRFMELIERKFQ